MHGPRQWQSVVPGAGCAAPCRCTLVQKTETSSAAAAGSVPVIAGSRMRFALAITVMFGAVLLMLAFALAQPQTSDDWLALVASIDRDVAQADAQGRKIPKLDREERQFIRKMANELTAREDAKPTAAQGQWLLSIRAWIDAAR
jgi:hypothetical protein